MKTLSKPFNGGGFTILELIIAMFMGLVVLGAVYGALTEQNRNVLLQEQLAEMQWNARTAMEIMMRDIRMAGYNPQGSVGSGIQPGITVATAQALGFVADLNGNGSTSPDSTNPTKTSAMRSTTREASLTSAGPSTVPRGSSPGMWNPGRSPITTGMATSCPPRRRFPQFTAYGSP
jgi:Tfp pilus assembly protein PilW